MSIIEGTEVFAASRAGAFTIGGASQKSFEACKNAWSTTVCEIGGLDCSPFSAAASAAPMAFFCARVTAAVVVMCVIGVEEGGAGDTPKDDEERLGMKIVGVGELGVTGVKACPTSLTKTRGVVGKVGKAKSVEVDALCLGQSRE